MSLSKMLVRSFLAILICFYAWTLSANAQAKKPKELVVEAIEEIFFKRNLDAVDRYVVSDYLQHQPGIPPGRKAFKEYLKKLFHAFPDYKGEIENVISEGDLVSLHIAWSGTHQHEFMGVRPTGKRITRRTADVLRVKSGKLVEHWGVVDQTEMLVVLGLLRPEKSN